MRYGILILIGLVMSNLYPDPENLTIEQLEEIIRDPHGSQALENNPGLLNKVKEMLNDSNINQKIMERAAGPIPLIRGCPVMYGGLGGVVRKAHEEKFKSQIEAIKHMGFQDENAIINALQEHDGNINAAVERLARN